MRRYLILLVFAMLSMPTTAESQADRHIELDPATKDSVLDAALDDLVLGHTLGLQAGRPVFLSPQSGTGDSLAPSRHRDTWVAAAIRRYRFTGSCDQRSGACPARGGALFLSLREPELQPNGLVLVHTSYVALHPMMSERQPYGMGEVPLYLSRINGRWGVYCRGIPHFDHGERRSRQ